jgi:hypothetical protein
MKPFAVDIGTGVHDDLAVKENSGLKISPAG